MKQSWLGPKTVLLAALCLACLPGATFASQEGVGSEAGFLIGLPFLDEHVTGENHFARDLGDNIEFKDIIAEVAGVYPRIMKEGLMDAGAWSCGMVAGLINDIPTCQELIDRIMSEADEIINKRLGGFLSA